MVSCGHPFTLFHLIGSMKTKEDILAILGEHFSETLVTCVDYVHSKDVTPEDVAKVIVDELEDWLAYHASMTNAAEAIRHALRERVS
jgi:hypothetical protein